MKYHLIEQKLNIHYTFGLLRTIITHHGHELVDTPADADMVLVSLCDVTCLYELEKIRRQHPKAKIVVGGHFGYYFKACAIFADYVCVGQGFDFFACQTEEEIRALPCVYYPGKDTKATPIVANQHIDWPLCPVIQTSTKAFFYMAGVGCKNKCRFCFTSWTHKHETNEVWRIQKAARAIGTRGILTLVSNEYGSDFRTGKIRVRDAMLRDFIKETEKNVRLVRMGLEFATEANRKKYGKPFTDEELFYAIEHAGRLDEADTRLPDSFTCAGAVAHGYLAVDQPGAVHGVPQTALQP